MTSPKTNSTISSPPHAGPAPTPPKRASTVLTGPWLPCDSANWRKLADAAGKAFTLGVVLYDGEHHRFTGKRQWRTLNYPAIADRIRS